MRTFKKYLNPSVNRLGEITGFKDLKNLSPLLENEYPYLKTLVTSLSDEVSYLLKQLGDLEKELEKQIEIVERETGDDKKAAVSIYNQILQKIQMQVERVNRQMETINSPYFGKIIFDRERSAAFPAKEITSYIGKLAHFDKSDGRSLITDWRAPIANLYYMNSGPKEGVEFDSPAGKQTGNLNQKRQFEISNARISHIYDAKSGNVAADEFLLSQLEKRLGKKLADIVSTIQEQQNKIIREDINQLSILQGVAGSGKTTIILHRLAYLLFAHPKDVTNERVSIIAPNKMFLDYISDVLPSLGVYGVESNTYIFWAKKVLKWDDRYLLSSERSLKSKKFKGSAKFLTILKAHLEQFEEDFLNDLPYSRKAFVKSRYYELKEKHPEIPLRERVNLAIERATLEKQFQKKVTGSYLGRNQISEIVRKKLDQYIRKSLDAKTIYLKLFQKNRKEIPADIAQYTKRTFKNRKGVKMYASEDLSGLTYIHFWIHGVKDHMRDYMIADEAQDMSPMQLLTLLMVSKKGNLMLAGDLAQAIIPPFYIQSWNELIELFKVEYPKLDYRFHELNRCYRTTVEIVEFANKVLAKEFAGKYKLPEAVLRRGDAVETIDLRGELSSLNRAGIAKLATSVNKQIEDGYVTVALLCKNEKHATAVYESLSKSGLIETRIINSDENDYRSGVLIIPITRAKGLEFDCVYMLDVSEKLYSDNELDARLLYVGLTRALHRLFIVRNMEDKISPLLNES